MVYPESTARAVHAEMLAEVVQLTDGWHPEAALVTRSLAEACREGPCAYRIVDQFGTVSSIVSRYDRAHMPRPKLQLQLLRLGYAFRLRRLTWSLNRIAFALNCSSSQAFYRTVRTYFAVPAAEIFCRWSSEFFWTHHTAQVIWWDDPRWASFQPLCNRHLLREGRRQAALAWRHAA